DAVPVFAPGVDLEACCGLAANTLFPVVPGEQFQVLSLDPAVGCFVLNLDVRKMDSRAIHRQSMLLCNRSEPSLPHLFGEMSCCFLFAVDRFLYLEIESHPHGFAALLLNLFDSLLVHLI